MKDFALAIYGSIDGLLKRQGPAINSRRELGDAQVAATVVISVTYFYGNQYAACVYTPDQHRSGHPG